MSIGAASPHTCSTQVRGHLVSPFQALYFTLQQSQEERGLVIAVGRTSSEQVICCGPSTGRAKGMPSCLKIGRCDRKRWVMVVQVVPRQPIRDESTKLHLQDQVFRFRLQFHQPNLRDKLQTLQGNQSLSTKKKKPCMTVRWVAYLCDMGDAFSSRSSVGDVQYSAAGTDRTPSTLPFMYLQEPVGSLLLQSQDDKTVNRPE